MAATKETRSRWIARLFPAEDVAFAGIDEIKASVATLAAKHFPVVEGAADGSLATYAIVYEHRAAPQALERNALIEAVAQVVPKSYKVDLKAPQKVILLQVRRRAGRRGPRAPSRQSFVALGLRTVSLLIHTLYEAARVLVAKNLSI